MRFPLFRRKPLFRGDLSDLAVGKNVIRQELRVNISIHWTYGRDSASFPVRFSSGPQLTDVKRLASKNVQAKDLGGECGSTMGFAALCIQTALFKGSNLDGLKWQVFVTESGLNFSLGMVRGTAASLSRQCSGAWCSFLISSAFNLCSPSD
jgi:hypothetical protein